MPLYLNKTFRLSRWITVSLMRAIPAFSGPTSRCGAAKTGSSLTSSRVKRCASSSTGRRASRSRRSSGSGQSRRRRHSTTKVGGDGKFSDPRQNGLYRVLHKAWPRLRELSPAARGNQDAGSHNLGQASLRDSVHHSLKLVLLGCLSGRIFGLTLI